MILKNGIAAHYLGSIQPEYGGPILWWEQGKTYVALASPQFAKETLLSIAASMSPDAELAFNVTLSPTSALNLDALDLLPVAVNTMWVYRATRYEAVAITEMITATHIITETVVDMQRSASYMAAQIHREESAETPVYIAPNRRGEPLQPAQSSDYWLVVMGNRVYRQRDPFDLKTLDETGELFLTLPLVPGARWYNNVAMAKLNPHFETDSMLWQVTQVGRVVIPAGEFDPCFFMNQVIGGSTFESWFCPGVGWVDQRDDHHGTPFGERRVLLSYHLESPNERVLPTPAP